MRQNKDIQYATLQTWNILNSDFNLLKTRFLSNLNINIFYDPWNITTYIVLLNELWNAINPYMINILSKTSKQKCYTIVTTKISKICLIHNNIKYIIKQTMSINKTQYFAPFLKIYKGMKVNIT
jgi:hypothetical protein